MSELRKKGIKIKLSEKGKNSLRQTPEPHTGVVTGLSNSNKDVVYVTLDGRKRQQALHISFIEPIKPNHP